MSAADAAQGFLCYPNKRCNMSKLCALHNFRRNFSKVLVPTPCISVVKFFAVDINIYKFSFHQYIRKCDKLWKFYEFFAILSRNADDLSWLTCL